MLLIPVTKFKLNRGRKQLYRELKICRKNIIKKYKFSPASPSRSPVPELYQLYKEHAKTEPDVLYYQLVKLYRRNFSRSAMGNICVGIASGVAAGLVSSLGIFLYQATGDPVALLVCLFISVISVVIVSCYCEFAAHFALPLFMPDFLSQREIEIIGELLNIEQYFFARNLRTLKILKIRRPLKSATLIKKPIKKR